MECPKDLKYLKTHEWAKVEGEGAVARVGITDFAQHELTDVVYVELPKPGRMVKAGEAVVVIESVKTAVDVYSPVSGKIVAANDKLTGDPGLINRSAYQDGWIFTVEMSDKKEWDALLGAETYAAQLAGK